MKNHLTRTRMAWLTLVGMMAALSWGAYAAGSNETWLRTYAGSEYGAFFDITPADSQDVVVVGATYHALGSTSLGDVLVAELTLSGDIVWKKTYGGKAHDQGLYVQKMDDGGYLVLGETESEGAGGRDLYLLHVDATGGLIWERPLGGAGEDWAKDMIKLADGGFLLVSESNSFGPGYDTYVVRLDAAGDEVWSTILDSGANESGSAALEGANGNLYVLATIYYDGGSSQQYRDTRMYCLDENGQQLWTTLYHDDDIKQAGDDMAWTQAGDIVIAGLSAKQSSGAELLDFWLARVDASTGDLQWSLSEGSQYADDYGIALSPELDGSYVVAGLGPGFPLLRFTEDGSVTWLRRGTTDTYTYAGFAVLELADGGFLIPGFKYLNTYGDTFDAVLLYYVE